MIRQLKRQLVQAPASSYVPPRVYERDCDALVPLREPAPHFRQLHQLNCALLTGCPVETSRLLAANQIAPESYEAHSLALSLVGTSPLE